MTEGRGIFSKLWFIKYVIMGIIVVALIVPFFEDVKDDSTLYMFLFLLPFICFAGAIVFYSSFDGRSSLGLADVRSEYPHWACRG